MKTLLLVGLIATTAVAQAPDSISGVIYDEVSYPAGSLIHEASVVSLRADGTYSLIVRERYFWLTGFLERTNRNVAQTDEGTYRYMRTGPTTATLTFTSSIGLGIVSRNLEFDSAKSGHLAYALSIGGLFHISSISAAPIVNASVRGTASSNKPMILGFYVPERASYVLIRAIGPSLMQFDVPDAAEDTTLEIVGKPLLPPGPFVYGPSNDDWETDSFYTLEPGASLPTVTIGAFMGAFPLPEGSKDAALALRLPAGTYTAIIRTKSETPAEVLGEIYIVP